MYGQFLAEEPCNILNHSGLTEDNIANATIFLNANRIKKWKPLNDNVLEPNKAYCYIDNDSDKKIFDIMMNRSNACTMSMFKNNPIVEDVFENNIQDTTLAYAHNKCVIKMNPDNMNETNMNNLWSTFGTYHCEGLATNLYKYNNERRADIDVVKNDVNTLTKTLQTKKKVLKGLNDEVLGLQNEINELNSMNTFLNKTVADLLQNTSNMSSDFESYKTNCKETIQNLTYEIEDTEKQITTYKEEMEVFSVEKKQKEKDIAKQTRYIEEIEVSYSNDLSRYAWFQEENPVLEKRFNELNNDLIKCIDQKNIYNTLRSNCINNTIVTEENIESYSNNIAICKPNVSSCQYQLSNLKVEINETILEYEKFWNKWYPCNKEIYPKCIRELNTYETLYNKEKREHDDWKNLPHYDCKFDINSLETSDIEWDRNKQKCEIIQRDKQTLHDEYTQFMSIYYEHKAAKAEDCARNQQNIDLNVNLQNNQGDATAGDATTGDATAGDATAAQ